jgi:hypothetical protein
LFCLNSYKTPQCHTRNIKKERLPHNLKQSRPEAAGYQKPENAPSTLYAFYIVKIIATTFYLYMSL